MPVELDEHLTISPRICKILHASPGSEVLTPGNSIEWRIGKWISKNGRSPK